MLVSHAEDCVSPALLDLSLSLLDKLHKSLMIRTSQTDLIPPYTCICPQNCPSSPHQQAETCRDRGPGDELPSGARWENG